MYDIQFVQFARGMHINFVVLSHHKGGGGGGGACLRLATDGTTLLICDNSVISIVVLPRPSELLPLPLISTSSSSSLSVLSLPSDSPSDSSSCCRR